MTEQEMILTSVLKCRRVDLYAKPRTFSARQREMISEIESRREAHEPLQYILQTAEFMGLDFLVDERVLIPRPETELLVEAVEHVIKKSSEKVLRILDIGTGSGNIVVSLAQRNPDHVFYAMDKSPDALRVATLNAVKHHVAHRIVFTHADLFSSKIFLTDTAKFDIIISNPPYIKAGDIDTLSLEVQQEPRLALDGGDDGLHFYRQIARQAGDWLSPGGLLCLEMGLGQEKEITDIFQASDVFQVETCLRDHAGIQRIMMIKRK